MIPEFKNLTQQEINTIIDAPILVTILIAGAEGKIDEREIDWGAYVIHFRVSDYESSSMMRVYKETDTVFSDSLTSYLENLPKDTDERSRELNARLAELNPILRKVDPKFAREFYDSLKTLAKQVAKSSGGIWGYGSISPQEQKYLDLDVIEQPEYDPES
ncbi:MAG: hypothetical protein K1X85_08830 [Ignavibacteria bacterium]|nr:hypothetical protein [Ignavibacteria bacterium]